MHELTGGDNFDPILPLQTVAAAARALRLGRTRVFELIGDGKLQRVKIGKSTRITTTSILAFIEAQTAKAA